MENYIDNIINGYEYICDRCTTIGQNNSITMTDYHIHVKYDECDNPIYRYCTPCWNYMQLRTFICPNCNSHGTIRSELDYIPRHCEILKNP